MEILFIHQYNTTFILRDKFFFEEHYPVIDLDFSRKYQNFLGRIKQIYFIFKKMKKADVAIIWFADFPAFIATFLKKITNKFGFGIQGYIYAIAHFLLFMSPSIVKKLVYKYMR